MLIFKWDTLEILIDLEGLKQNSVCSTRKKEVKMFTDNVNARKEDKESVNVQDPMELRYWSNFFGVTKEDILEAVREEDSTKQGIERYIKRVKPRT